MTALALAMPPTNLVISGSEASEGQGRVSNPSSSKKNHGDEHNIIFIVIRLSYELIVDVNRIY
jgi:hypothetical protein